mmetsp:Transcript_56984/g.105361  ORF Transcript_56984/g.105361 Transcript_56984/m.105361 type:complete len:427 (-) Transcript_56984:127-1407(-)
MALHRIQKVSDHIVSAGPPLCMAPTSASMSSAGKADDDVVICCALRTPLAKANRGSFKDMPPEDLLAPVFKAVVAQTKVDPKVVGDIKIGNVSCPGAAALTTRMSQFMGGIPHEVPLSTVNRQCSSGLQAVAEIASSIKAGVIDVGIAGGVESMSMFPMTAALDVNKISAGVLENEGAKACLMPMGITSENVAAKWQISRETQDEFAAASHAKAVAAQKAGLFDDEIVPVKAIVKEKGGGTKEVLLKADEGPRADTTVKGLSGLKPAFKAGGSTTAGNSSQVTDGAALVLLARRSAAQKLGLPILARMRSYAVVGVEPTLMGIGPAYAIPAALDKAGVKVGDVDIYEINEAFASQATMSVDHLKIPAAKVNPKGGAIALGHPLGCTGARQIATLLPELKRTGKRLGVVSMCIGTGMGAAGVFESEQ